MNLTAFTPPNLSSASEGVDALAGPVPEKVQTQVGVVRWEPIAVKLMAGGTPVSEIAQYVKKTEEEVLGFLTGRGREMIKALVDERPAQLGKILEGAEVDVVLTLMRIAKHGKQESAQVSAAKVLLDMAQTAKGKNTRTPEEIKRLTEERIAKRLARKKVESLS